MGCGGSQPADKSEDKGLDLDIGKLEAKKGSQASGDDVPNSQRVTSSGYLSDLQSDRPAFTHAFVHSHIGKNAQAELLATYDTEGGMVLGRGACGSVVGVKHKTSGELYAMKVISLNTVGGSLEELKKEIDVQRALDHPNICKIFESFEDTSAEEVYIIMEICTGGSLVSRMKTHRHGYGEKAAATLIEKMLSAVIYCHHHGVVHRDIKLDNFIYENEAEDSELKLIDFGFAAEVRASGERGARGEGGERTRRRRKRVRRTWSAPHAARVFALSMDAACAPPCSHTRVLCASLAAVRLRRVRSRCGTSLVRRRTWHPSCGGARRPNTIRPSTCGPSAS